MATDAVRVLVVDRQPLMRRGVVAVLADEPDLDVVGDTADSDQAFELAFRLRPDVVLLDLDLAGGGVVACERLRIALPDVPLVILASAEDDADLVGVVRAGARGYLLRDTSPAELADALRTVAAGRSLLSPAMTSRLLDEFAVLVRRNDASGEGSATLSPREREVLALVAEGLNNRAIAERLFISENTVKNHVRSIHEKLQVHSRMEAVVRAVRDGVLAIG
ncbi:MAG TPA: response regulator transcription factor [Candidatus Nanopelagicales bacterium]|jgi:two-component system NarL family response regulator